MLDKNTLEAVLKLLDYSFKDMDYDYNYLTKAEKEIISPEQFNTVVSEIKKGK